MKIEVSYRKMLKTQHQKTEESSHSYLTASASPTPSTTSVLKQEPRLFMAEGNVENISGSIRICISLWPWAVLELSWAAPLDVLPFAI